MNIYIYNLTNIYIYIYIFNKKNYILLFYFIRKDW